MKILLKKATLINDKSVFHNKKVDILIENGLLSKIDNNIDVDADQLINLEELYVSSGWFDPNISFGEPGFEERETLENGLLTAAKSGFTHVLLNPNTNPKTSTLADVNHLIQSTLSQTTKLHVSAVLSEKKYANKMASLYDMHIAGAKAFGNFNETIINPNELKIALDYVQTFDGIVQSYPIDKKLCENGQIHEGEISVKLGLKGIPSISESIPLARDIQILEYTEGKIHIPYVSTEKSVELIRQAKKRGLNISCAVGLPHLIFTDKELMDFDPNFKIIPPIRTHTDKNALREGLLDGTIDMITSMHQPVNPELKDLDFVQSEPGSIGLEACFVVLQDKFPIEKIISYLTRGKKRFGIEDHNFKLNTPADLTLFTPTGNGIFSSKDLYSKNKNCMFLGMPIKGKVYGCIRENKVLLNT